MRLIFSSLLVVVSLRDYLFGNGLFLYRDWSWPLSTSIAPVNVFSPGIVTNSGPDPLGFTRMFLNWPIVLIDAVTQDPILAEKIFIIYLYAVLLFLAFILGEILLRMFEKFGSRSLSVPRREIFIMFVVVFVFANLWSVQQFSDFYYTYIYGLLITSISSAFIILRESSRRSLVVGGLLVSSLGFLAPEVYPFSWLAIVVVALAVGLHSPIVRALRSAASRLLILVTVNLPLVATMLYIYNATLGTAVRPINSYGVSLSSLSPDNAIRLLGYWWSLVTYSPPTVGEGTSVSQLSSVGLPPYMVLTGDITSMFWLITTWMVPVLAFSTLAIRRLRRISVPASTVGVIGFLLTQPVIFPVPHLLAVALQGEKTLGGAVASILAIPDHALIMVASSYVVLVSVLFYHVMSVPSSTFGEPGKTLRFGKVSLPTLQFGQLTSLAVPAVIIVLLLLPGWQFFSGSFYPAGYTSGVAGNGVPNVGTFSPARPPSEMIDAYHWLQSQEGSYNIYWPGPDGSAAYPWSGKATPSVGYAQSPKPTVQNWVLDQSPFPSALKYLVESNLTSDIAPYLEALNVKYVVVQPLSDFAMSIVWGTSEVTQVTQVLGLAPGLTLAYSVGSVSIFQVSTSWGSSYPADLVLGYPAGNDHYGVTYGLLESAGLHPALVTSDQPSQLCFDTQSCAVAIESPGYIAATILNGASRTALDDPIVQASSSTLSAATVSSLPSPWMEWSLADWGPGSAAESIANGILHWSFGPGEALLSLSYNGTVTDNSPGGITIPEGPQATVLVSFSYRTSSSFNSNIQVVLPLLNGTQRFFDQPASQPFLPSTSWEQANFSTILPSAARDFGARIQADTSSGWVELKNVVIRVSFLPRDQQSFFGSLVPLGNNAQVLPISEDYSFLQYTGNGTVTCNGQKTRIESVNQLSWIQVGPCLDGSLGLSGVSLGAVILTRAPLPRGTNTTQPNSGGSVTLDRQGSVVIPLMYAPGYTLASQAHSYQPLRTLDGVMLFQGVQPGSYTVKFSALNIAIAAYSATLIFTAVMILTPSILMLVKRVGRRELSPVVSERQPVMGEEISV